MATILDRQWILAVRVSTHIILVVADILVTAVATTMTMTSATTMIALTAVTARTGADANTSITTIQRAKRARMTTTGRPWVIACLPLSTRSRVLYLDETSPRRTLTVLTDLVDAVVVGGLCVLTRVRYHDCFLCRDVSWVAFTTLVDISRQCIFIR